MEMETVPESTTPETPEPVKLETRGRKRKYNTDEDRINARKQQQKRYRERQKEKVKELLSLVEGLSPEDIAELKMKAQELREKNAKNAAESAMNA